MQIQQRAQLMLKNNHYDPDGVHGVAESVLTMWQQLMVRADERHKLVTTSMNFYKTAEQVGFI